MVSLSEYFRANNCINQDTFSNAFYPTVSNCLLRLRKVVARPHHLRMRYQHKWIEYFVIMTSFPWSGPSLDGDLDRLSMEPPTWYTTHSPKMNQERCLLSFKWKIHLLDAYYTVARSMAANYCWTNLTYIDIITGIIIIKSWAFLCDARTPYFADGTRTKQTLLW